jgi:hypothetical protein
MENLLFHSKIWGNIWDLNRPLPNLAAVCIARDSSPEASGKLGSDRHYKPGPGPGPRDLLPQIARQVLSSRPAGPARPGPQLAASA